MIGLGLNATKNPTVKKTIVRDGLVLRHDYKDRPVELVSSGAASFIASSNDSITTSNDTGLRPGAGSFSVSCWVNSNQKGSSAFALGKADNTNTTAGVGTGFALYLGNGGTDWIFWVADGTDRAITATTTEANANQWYHLCGTFDTSGTDTVRLYVDGVLINSSAQALDTVDVSNNLEIGRIAGVATNDWDGYICNVGFWKGVVLTQPQIKSIMHKDYAALSASEKDDLDSWWNLDEETATDGTAGTGGVKDHEGSNHGTLA